MKQFKPGIMFVFLVAGWSALAFAAAGTDSASPKTTIKSKETVPKSIKGAKAVPGPFQVKQVQFKEMVVNSQTRLVAAVVFNRNLDASSVKENSNIRLLKKNENHFWVDASTQNNIVRIRPNFITWVSGAPLETGVYIMHLRGTIKSADGVYLDCNGDGKGEGGNLPAFESKMYQAHVLDLEEKDEGIIRIDPHDIQR
jgi:hypothetical protein